jgi:hypothetical protein
MFVAALTALSAANHSAIAQEAARRGLEITKLKVQSRQAPNYGVGSGDLGGEVPAANKQWLWVEVEFESKPDWADDVQLKYYVVMGKGKEAKLFVGEMTHVNVAKGSRHYSAMFLHPNTLDRFGRGSAEVPAAVELRYRGQLMDTRSEPNTGKPWWNDFTPTPGFLLPPSRTPWAVVAHRRFEAEKAGP